MNEEQLSLALMLFKKNKISIGKAREIAGIDIYEFQKECKKHQIPIINYSLKEIEAELNMIQRQDASNS